MARQYKVRSTVDADWDRQPLVEGIVSEKPKAIEQIEGRRVMLLRTDDALVRVYESFDLHELFDAAEVGDNVRIEYRGMIDVKGGRTMRKFAAALWRES